MSTTVQIDLEKDVFERLQALAKPFVDTPSSIIRRLLDESEGLRKQVVTVCQNEQEQHEKLALSFFITSRGEHLPLGQLRATYSPRGSTETHDFEAEVTLDGIAIDDKVFKSPSAAGIHAKKLVGADDSASNTNGWDFWEYFDEQAGAWVGIQKFRS